MTERETTKTAVAESPRVRTRTETQAWGLGALGWAVPGLGHLLLKKYDRAGGFFVSIAAMASLGLAMGGKLYGPPFDHSQGSFVTLLHLLGFVGDLGAGALFFVARFLGMGQEYMNRALGDYGTVFFLCAGLLNLLTALDAYDIAVGKKE
ncbi:MAG TPA: DUF6677 family protein [Candidatus Acidoferrales bacterium]|nr:DUF6677 family protein [Candidatus Acidoferrales bacterium]